MTEPTFDSDGYPTSETLQAIVDWPFVEKGAHGLLDFVRRAWRWDDYFGEYETREDGHIHVAISTGGWSGNEDLIGALMENNLFWLMCWESSRRGGHYTLDIRANLWKGFGFGVEKKPLDKNDEPITLGPEPELKEES